jgi:hypothetical protein
MRIKLLGVKGGILDLLVYGAIGLARSLHLEEAFRMSGKPTSDMQAARFALDNLLERKDAAVSSSQRRQFQEE